MKHLPIWVVLSACFLAHNVRADDAKQLAEDAVKAAGGVDTLPKFLKWKETYFLNEQDKKGTVREAIIVPPTEWYQNGTNIAAGNPDRMEKTYLVWVWTLAPLVDKDTKLKLLPEEKYNNVPIVGLRVTRERQKDIDVFFDKETKQLARIDWRAYQIDFADWKETGGHKYPSKAFVRFKDGKFKLRTEFQLMEFLKELPTELKK